MITLKRLTITVFLVNLVLMSYTVFIFMFKVPKEINQGKQNEANLIKLFSYNYSNNADYNYWSPWDKIAPVENEETIKSKKLTKKSNEPLEIIEIWSKAAIGQYLWEHILKGKLSKKNQLYQYGFKKIHRFKVKFRAGPSLTPQSLDNFLAKSDNPQDFGVKKNIILILNGRSKEKIKFAKSWLDKVVAIRKNKDSQLFNVAAFLLGHESCFNNWIKPYLSSNGGPLKFLFVVYDWKEVDNKEIYQWPLGVATYRNFPNPDPSKLNFRLSRPYVCNFLGTVYPNSSRVALMEILKGFDEGICFSKIRTEWEPNETQETLDLYLQALRLSDLTLSPIGMNHECYRIYEALAYGSLPVLEENLNHVNGYKSNCDHSSVYRLLKQYNAPVIYLANWTLELSNLIEKEMSLSLDRKVNRRIKLTEWYNSFKAQLRDHLLNIVEEKFELQL